MPIRSIVRFPDARLRTPAAPVERFDADLAALAADLLDTMRAAPGIGITAPHIGVLQRLTVIEIDPEGALVPEGPDAWFVLMRETAAAFAACLAPR